MFASRQPPYEATRRRCLLWLGVCGFALALVCPARGAPNGGWGPSWSPTGRTLAFLSAGPAEAPNIWLAGVEGSPRQLTRAGARRIEGWSPDGEALFYLSVRDGALRRYQVDVASGESTLAPEDTPEGAAQCYPSPDGSWLALIKTEGSSADLWLRHAQTGEEQQLTEEFRVTEVAWRPDSTVLAFASAAARGLTRLQVWVYDVAAGKLGHLAIKAGHNPQWSPDGALLSVDSFLGPGRAMPFTVEFTGEEPETRPHSEATHRGAGSAWSPDGGHLAVVGATKRGGDRLWLLDRDGNIVKRLGRPGLSMRQPTWSADGRFVAFEAMGRSSSASEVCTANVRGGQLRRLTPSWPSVTHCRWSPGGRHVGYVRHERGRLSLELLDLSNGRTQRLPLAHLGHPTDWRWSPDGDTLALQAGPRVFLVSGTPLSAAPLELPAKVVDFCWGPTADVMLASVSMGGAPFIVRFDPAHPAELEPLLGPPTADRPQGSNGSQVAVSPDGVAAAFVRDGEVLVASIEGGTCRTLVDLNNQEEGRVGVARHPGWSPDGRLIAYQVWREVGEEQFTDLCVVPAAGGGPRVVDSERIASEYQVLADRLTWPPAWAPDGRGLALSSDRWGEPNVLVVAADGSGATRLEGAVGGYPSWAPDGRALVYCPVREASRALLAVSVDSAPRPPRPVLSVWRRLQGVNAP